jgi:predicted nucleic acid-binding protein
MPWAILDSNIYIGHWEGGLYANALAEIRKTLVIRHSAVVLSELRRGARVLEAQRRVDELFKLATVKWEPSVEDWWKAGKIIRTIGDKHNWGTDKRRDFQNDALIALTALRYGATVVTANEQDFHLLARELGTRVKIALVTD